MTKRFLSLVLVVLMTLSLYSPALALTETAEPDQAAPISAPEAIDLPVPAAEGPAPTITVESTTLAKDTEGGEIVLTASGKDFYYQSGAEDQYYKTNAAVLFILSVANANDLKVAAEGYALSQDGKTAILTVTGTPSQSGSATLQVPSGVLGDDYAGETRTVTVTIGDAAKIEVAPPSWTPDAETKEFTVTVTGSLFKDSVADGNFELSGEVGSPTITQAVVSEGGKKATLTVSGINKKGTLTITAKQDAFKYKPQDALTTTVNIEAPTGSVSAKLDKPLTAGAAADGTTITLMATEKLKFKNDPDTSNFTLNGDGAAGLSIESVSGENETMTLTLSGTPEKYGKLTSVTVKQEAFKYQPDGEQTAKFSASTTVGYAEVTLDASPKSIAAGTMNATITITATGSVFNECTEKNGNFTVTAGGHDILTGVKADAGSPTAKLTINATETGDVTITVKPEAFKYKPENEVEATGVSIAAPKGTIKATLEKGVTLTAGEDATGKKITVSLGEGATLTFKTNTSTDYFPLDGDGADGLSISSAVKERGLEEVTLTLSGTPNKAGDITVKAEKSAFNAEPTNDVAAVKVTTVQDPAIKLSAAPITAGKDTTITITNVGVAFKDEFSGSVADYFQISNGEVTIQSATSSGTTATLTLDKAPSNPGSLTVTVKPAAFQYQPAGNREVPVEVDSPDGSIRAALGDGSKLTAGEQVNGQTIKVTATGGLIFNETPGVEHFILGGTGVGNLNVIDAQKDTDQTVTLTLSGTPGQHGDITVTVQGAAFTTVPGELAKLEYTIENAVGYPTVTMTAATSDGADLPDDGGTVKLTSTGSVFSESAEPKNFSLSISGLTIQTVVAEGNTATLTIGGTAHNGGDMTITAQPAAFKYLPENAVESSSKIKVEEPVFKLSSKPSTVTLGTDTQPVKFKITVAGGTFNSDLIDHLSVAFLDGVSGTAQITAVTVSEDKASADVTVDNITTNGVDGTLEIKAETAAFEEPQPTNPITVHIDVKAPRVTLTASPATIEKGEAAAITITAKGDVFKSIASPWSSSTSITNDAKIGTVTANQGSNSVRVGLSRGPQTAGDMTITVPQDAFMYTPHSDSDLTVIITVTDPSPSPSSTPVPSIPSGPSGPSGPTNTPEPTATPVPSTSPEPTASPEPSTSPEPTATPVPSATPVPTASPVPTTTPEPQGELVEKDGKTYCVDEDGEFLTGKQNVDGTDYYFSEKDGHRMKSGVVNAGGGTLYYLSAKDGHIMKGGWINAGDGKYYYAQNDGSLKCGKFTALNGKDYYTNSKGLRQTGKQTIGGKDYYFSVKDGHMMKGGLVTGPGGKQYYVSAKDGHMMKGGWARGQSVKSRPGYSYYYYLDKTGVVIETTQLLTKKWPTYTPKG